MEDLYIMCLQGPMCLCLIYFAGIDWIDYKKKLKKAEQWNVEVY